MSCDFCTSGSVSALLRHHVAGFLGACLGLAAGGFHLRQFGNHLRELLLIEARLLFAAAFEDVGFATELLDGFLGCGRFLRQFVDLGFEDALDLVRLVDGLGGERFAVSGDERVRNGGCAVGIDGGEADADRAALLRE